MNLNQNAAPPSTSPLDQALVSIDGRLGHLFNGLHELFERLEPILTQTSNKAPNPPPSPQPGASPVVEKLHQFSLRIEGMIEQLANIRARLET